jgi:hypothetical protein
MSEVQIDKAGYKRRIGEEMSGCWGLRKELMKVGMPKRQQMRDCGVMELYFVCGGVCTKLCI